MKKSGAKQNGALRFVQIGLLVLIICSAMIFMYMNTQIKSLNEDAMERVGFLYTEGLSKQMVLHANTYFENNFALQKDALGEAAERPENGQKEHLREALLQRNELLYVALYDTEGRLEVLVGDKDYHIYDQSIMDRALALRRDMVIIMHNTREERILGMVNVQEFTLDGGTYSAIICGVLPEVINDRLNLSHNDDMVYSYIISREGNFVVRNEGAFRESYFNRIHERYKEYGEMTSEDYVRRLSEAMERGETCEIVFTLEEERHLLYATSMSYSEWYLVTIIPYTQLENILGENNTHRNHVVWMCALLLCVVYGIVFSLYIIISRRQIKVLEELEKEAVAASKAKSEFLSNMSHDIRTPMNAIIGMTNIASANLDNREKTEECLKKISQASNHLLSLINDVLDMSKIESGKMTLSITQMSLRKSMENLVMIIQPQIKSKHQKFDIYIQNIIAEEIYCDNLRLNQVIINLLSNAVKYTPDGGNISLVLTQETSALGEEYVRNHIRVKDNGIGMTEEFQKTIFDAFTREDRTRVKKVEGTGLGLAIVKRIVETMGGSIEVESRPNQGSEFHVVLDLKKGDVDEEHMTLENLRALVVDDDEELCRSTQYALKEIHADADYVTRGREAVERVKENPDCYDVILLDWQMPEMNGVETAREITKYVKKDTLLLLTSAYDWEDCAEEARSAGIRGFIPKPLFKSTLFFGIRQYIAKDSKTVKAQEMVKTGWNGERILLAEDNDLNAEIAMEILTKSGLSVDWAENGRLCVEKFSASEEGYYDVVLMDIRMPEMDGYEAATKIRALDRDDADVPIIAMTADAFAEDVARALKCGMNGHIAKPIDVQTLFYALQEQMGSKS
ncbi:MAG: response regulator [Acetatifactor sp.]|nr:response regulator [Acetatifactor sp.]